MGMAAIQRGHENHMKTVEFEDETNMVERRMKNIVVLVRPQCSTSWHQNRIFRCGDVFINFIHFLPSRVSRIKINLKIIKFN